MIETSKPFKGETSLLWFSSKLEKALDGFAASVPRSSGTLSAADVQDCATGNGPLADLYKGTIAAVEFTERYGAEGRALRFILGGMKAAADRLLLFLGDDRRMRVLPPPGLRLRQINHVQRPRELAGAAAKAAPAGLAQADWAPLARTGAAA